MDHAEEIATQKLIRGNIRALYEGSNAKNIPVKSGFEADLKNPKPILAQVLGESTRFTVAPWVDMESWFKELGVKFVYVRDSYSVSTSFIDNALKQKIAQTGQDPTAKIQDR